MSFPIAVGSALLLLIPVGQPVLGMLWFVFVTTVFSFYISSIFAPFAATKWVCKSQEAVEVLSAPLSSRAVATQLGRLWSISTALTVLMCAIACTPVVIRDRLWRDSSWLRWTPGVAAWLACMMWVVFWGSLAAGRHLISVAVSVFSFPVTIAVTVWLALTGVAGHLRLAIAGLLENEITLLIHAALMFGLGLVARRRISRRYFDDLARKLK